MGCCQSSFLRVSVSQEKASNNNSLHQAQNHHASNPSNGTDAASAASEGFRGFTEFSLADLKAATNNFSPEFIVSESGEKAPNVVYKGRLQNQDTRTWIAVKKFAKLAWPDPKQFAVITIFWNFFSLVFIFNQILGFFFSCMYIFYF